MALSERSRTTIYQALTPLTGEEAIGEMLSNFPTRDVDEPVTREHLDRRLAEVGADLRAEFHRDMAAQTRWLIGTYVGLQATTIAVVATLVGRVT